MTKKSPKTAPASKAAPVKKPSTGKAAPASASSVPAVSEKIAKGQIVELMSERGGLTKKDAGSALDAVLEVVVDALKSGKMVGLPGLGTFAVKTTAARTGVRPGTSEKIQIPAGKKVSFKVASDLKSSI